MAITPQSFLDTLKQRVLTTPVLPFMPEATAQNAYTTLKNQVVGGLQEFGGNVRALTSAKPADYERWAGELNKQFQTPEGRTALINQFSPMVMAMATGVQDKPAPTMGTPSIENAARKQVAELVNIEPVLNTKREIPVTDIHGAKAIIPAGEALTPYQLKGNKILLKDGDEYIVSKNQYQNIKGNSMTGQAPQQFAPELTQTTETVKGYSPSTELPSGLTLMNRGELGWDIVEKDNMNPHTGLYKTPEEALKAYFRESGEPTKYSQYTLPGGENYREILIQAQPERTVVGKTAGGATISLGDITKEFRGAHWDEPNILAHIRMDDRVAPDGGKVAFMEELQSDWAREARKNVLQDTTGWTAKQTRNGADGSFDVWEVRDANGNKVTDIVGGRNTAEQAIRQAAGEHTPTNPLLKDWQQLAVKRALKDAVQNNADYFSWTNGAQQQARYNLSKQVDSISWEPGKVNGTPGRVVYIRPSNQDMIGLIVDKDGKVAGADGYAPSNWVGKNISDVIGKGISEKIMGKSKGTVAGKGLDIGGTWANRLYDEQVKNIVEDVTGGKVENMDLGLGAGGNDQFYFKTGGIPERPVQASDLKPGNRIYNKSDNYIVTQNLGRGKVRVVENDPSMNVLNDQDLYNMLKEKGYISKANDYEMTMADEQRMYHDPDILRALNKSNYATTIDTGTGAMRPQQQVLRLTPAVKARILDEAIPIKQPSNVWPQMLEILQQGMKPPVPAEAAARQQIKEAAFK